MDFQTFHDYNRLARRGLVSPLVHPYCGTEWVVRLGPDDEPVLQCFMCGSLTTPGSDLYNRLREAVKEYNG